MWNAQLCYVELMDSGTCDDGHMDVESSDVRPRRSTLPPELTGDPATDRALWELAEVLAEIARKSHCIETDRQRRESSDN